MFLILLLPLAFYGIYEKIHDKTGNRADALAGAILLYEAFVVVLANALSIGGHLSPLTAACAFLILVFFLFTAVRKPGTDGILLPVLKERGKRIKAFFKSVPGRLADLFSRLSLWETALLLLSGLLCMFLLFVALLNVPYNYDSMTYHLARVAHWIDNGSVGYYLTNIDRQLYSPVLSEYDLLFMMLLSGSDALLNLHQYAEMLLSAYFIYVLLKRLGCSRLFSLFGVFAFLTMPLTLSQAITTQNDLGALLFYLIFLYYLLGFNAQEQIGSLGTLRSEKKLRAFMLRMLCLGASVGFAFLMKPSVCASMVFFMPWVLCVCIKRKDNLLSVLLGGVGAFLTLAAVAAETLIRTFRATGHLVSSATGGDLCVATKNVAYILVNLLKNYCLLITQHFWTGLNGFMYRIAISAGRILQVEVNNEAIAFHGFDFITYLNTGLDMYSHDRTSSAFAAYFALLGGVLLIVALIVKAVRLVSKKSKGGSGAEKTGKEQAIPFTVSAWLGFGFILALLRWQPWGSRLLYPGLAVALTASVSMLAYFTDRGAEKTKAGARAAVLILALLSFVLSIKPLSDNATVAFSYLSSGLTAEKREELMFSNHKHYYASYLDLLEMIEKTGAKDIGLIISGDGYDYPLWKMLRDRDPEARIRHIIADDEAMRVLSADPETLPDCILWVERGERKLSDRLDYFGSIYTCGFVSDADGAPDSIFYFDKVANKKSKEELSSGGGN